ncbi:hypothetical protein D1872_176410 [compost metagenome]
MHPFQPSLVFRLAGHCFFEWESNKWNLILDLLDDPLFFADSYIINISSLFALHNIR